MVDVLRSGLVPADKVPVLGLGLGLGLRTGSGSGSCLGLTSGSVLGLGFGLPRIPSEKVSVIMISYHN